AKKGGKKIVDDWQIPKVRKTLFCQPGDPVDNDFYLNYHPSNNSVGYEGEHHAVEIPEQYALEGHHSPDYARDIYQTRFMTTKERVYRITLKDTHPDTMQY
ncbi:hypothetical protein RYX36_019053, partial [Vicia faba]